MAGIAEALVATGVGLFVAIPAVIAYNVVQKRIGDIESGAISLAKLLTAYVKSTRVGEPLPLTETKSEPALTNGVSAEHLEPSNPEASTREVAAGAS
jgi:hypothetical protein